MKSILYPNNFPSVQQEAISYEPAFWLRIGPTPWSGVYLAGPYSALVTFTNGDPAMLVGSV